MIDALVTQNNSFEDLITNISDLMTTINNENWIDTNENISDINAKDNSHHVIASKQNASLKILSFLIQRVFSSSDQLLAKNSTITHRIENISTFSKDDYQSVEEWMSFENN